MLLTSCDCTTLWVKQRTVVVAAMSTKLEYLRNKMSDTISVVEFKDRQIPLARSFGSTLLFRPLLRGLKLWMVLRMYGADFLQSYIRSHCNAAKHFELLVRSDPRFEVRVRRMFSLLCFRPKPPAGDPNNGYALNAKLVEAVNTSGNIFITHTVLGGVRYTPSDSLWVELERSCDMIGKLASSKLPSFSQSPHETIDTTD